MGIEQNWDERDQSIIRCTITDDWSWESYHDSTIEIAKMGRAVDHRFDVIVDMRDAGRLPLSAASLQLKSALEKMPDNYGVTVFVDPDKFMRMILESLDRVLPKAKDHFFVVETVNAARRMVLLQRGAGGDSGFDSETRPIFPYK